MAIAFCVLAVALWRLMLLLEFHQDRRSNGVTVRARDSYWIAYNAASGDEQLNFFGY